MDNEKMKEVEALANDYLDGKITFQEFVEKVLTYPADIKDRGLALAILRR
jgi:hypothetical protein